MATPLSLAAFADRLPILANPFELEEMQEISVTGGGDTLAAMLAPSRWKSTVTTTQMPHLAARALQARIESLDGAIGSFYLYCVTNCYPASDPGGIILGSSGVSIYAIGADNRSLRLEGLPAGYALTTGDALAFDYGIEPVRRAWHRLDADVVANGGGITPFFALSTPLRPGVETGLAVILKKPAAKMFVVPKSAAVSQSAKGSTLTFQAMQRP